MARPRVAVDAAVLATPVWVDRLGKADVRRVVVRDDRACALDRHLRLEGDAFSLGRLLLRRPAVVEGLAPYIGLATLPVTCWILGGAIGTMPASLHMKRVGRQRGFTLGILWGVVGALICGTAMYLQSFWTLCLGTLVWGVYNAYGQYY